MALSGEGLRPLWPGRFDFLPVALTYVISIENIVRFPYLMYRNGGAIFLIPCLVFTIFFVVPLLLLQVTLGQFSNKDSLACRKSVPVFKGIGYSLLVANILTTLQNNYLCALACRYLFASLTPGLLPWSSCNNSWNTIACNDGGVADVGNYSQSVRVDPVSSASEYFERYLLKEQLSDGIFHFASFRFEIAIGCLCCVILIFLCLSFDVRSFGRLAYVFSLLPFPLLILLLIRAVSLPGSDDGVTYFVWPQLGRLFDLHIWIDACSHVFFSVGIAGSTMITLASFNRFHNCHIRDVFLVSFLDLLVGFLAGIVVFAFFGYLSHEENISIDEVVTSGMTMMFKVFPDILFRTPLPALWSSCFFLLIVILLIGTMISEQLKIPQRFKVLITAGVCSAIFLVGLIMCASNGMVIFTLLDHNLHLPFPLLCCLECLSIGCFYSAPRLSNDFAIMMGRRPSIIGKILGCIFWSILCPILLLGMFMCSMRFLSEPQYRDYVYPAWTVYVLWSILIAIVAIVPAYALFYVVRRTSGPCRQRLKQMVQPTDDWGPTLSKHRRLVDYAKTFHADIWRHHEEETALRLMNRNEPLGVSQTDGLDK